MNTLTKSGHSPDKMAILAGPLLYTVAVDIICSLACIPSEQHLQDIAKVLIRKPTRKLNKFVFPAILFGI